MRKTAVGRVPAPSKLSCLPGQIFRRTYTVGRRSLTLRLCSGSTRMGSRGERGPGQRFPTMRFADVIARKRDGLALTRAEIDLFVRGVVDGTVPDYQASALLMAIVLRGMDEVETVALTEAMVASGERVDLSDIPGPKVGKHSTRGVGDKLSIIVAPIVAACGVPVPKMSGRGLGHTGGTVDKLESIPGFRTSVSIDEFKQMVRDVG